MPLFAEAELNWFSVLMAVLSLLGGVASGVIALISARDKLRFDAERVEMRSQIKTLTEGLKVCLAERDVLRSQAERQQREIDRQQTQIADLQTQITQLRSGGGHHVRTP